MGIHYLARSVEPQEIARALTAPAEFARTAPLQSTDSLDLGRCWRCMQSLLRVGTPQERPSAELVRAPTTHAGLGHAAYARALAPGEVASIAVDLEDLLRDRDAVDLDACLFRFPTDTVRPHVEEALAFTQNLRSAGQGLIYMIDGTAPRRTAE